MPAGKAFNLDCRRRARAAAEIAFVVLCVLSAEWAVIPLFGRRKDIGMIFIGVVLVFGFFSHRARGESARDIGLGLHNFWRASRLLLLWMIPAAAVLVAVGWGFGSLHLRRPGDWSALVLNEFWLFLWGLMQQYALQAIVNKRSQEIWGKGAISIIAVSLIFSALHMPNLWLAAATLLGGSYWAWVYQEVPNLPALALSQSVMTTVLISSIPAATLHGLRVGYNYF